MRAKRGRVTRRAKTDFSKELRRTGKKQGLCSSPISPPLEVASSPRPRDASTDRNAEPPVASMAVRRRAVSAWNEAPLPSLISHIVSEHHHFTFRQLRRLERLLAQVVDEHARKLPQLVELQVLFLALSDKLTTHMIREEQMLFPYILQLDEAVDRGERLARPVFGTVRDPIDVLMVEHEGMKTALEKIRATAEAYMAGLEGSTSWKALSRGWKALEQDLLCHMQLEDTVLFPRAVGAENCDRCLIGV